VGLIPLLLLSIAAALWDWFPYYCTLLQRHCGTNSLTTTPYCSALWDWFPYYYSLFQRHCGTDSLATTLYCSGTVGLFPILFFSIAVELWDWFPYSYFLLQPHCEADSRITDLCFISGVILTLFSLFFFHHYFMFADFIAVGCSVRFVTTHYCKRTCSTVMYPCTLAALCCHSSPSLCFTQNIHVIYVEYFFWQSKFATDFSEHYGLQMSLASAIVFCHVRVGSS